MGLSHPGQLVRNGSRDQTRYEVVKEIQKPRDNAAREVYVERAKGDGSIA